MATSLLRHETIRTTVPKAKELRRVVEPLITLAKIDSLAKRRLAYSRLRDESVVEKLFARSVRASRRGPAAIPEFSKWNRVRAIRPIWR